MSVRDLIPWGRERSGEVMDPFLALHREMNRLFDNVFRSFDGRLSPAGFGGMGWPRMDVVETDAEYRVTAELPGLEEKDVELSFQDGVLTLRGEKKAEHGDNGRLHGERFYGRFQRSFSVGPDVDDERISASFRSGVLTVVLPKSPEAASKVKRIPISAH